MRHIKLLVTYALLGGLFLSCNKNKGVTPKKAPIVNFSYTPASPKAGDTVKFVATTQTGSIPAVSWKWNFGDSASSTATGQDPSFIYKKAGTYQITLIGTDAAGNGGEIIESIQVIPKPKISASIAWSFTTGTKATKRNDGTAPVIAKNGMIYYVTGFAIDGNHGEVVAVKDDGDAATELWSKTINFSIRQALSMGSKGNLYFGAWALDSGVYKLNGETGKIMWAEPTNSGVSNCTAAIDADGNVYLSTKTRKNSGILSFSSDGVFRWSVVNIGSAYASPAISKDGKTGYFLQTSTGSLYAVNLADGKLRWPAPLDVSDGYGTSVSIGKDGVIYLTTNTQVVAVKDNGSSGSVLWATSINTPDQSGIVIGPDGTLYTGSEGGLVALDPADGSVKWTYDKVKISESVPAVDANGNIYVGTEDGKFIIVGPDGKLLKTFILGTSVVNSPEIAANGDVYVAAMYKSEIKLYKITVEGGAGPADSPWPMKGQNAMHTSVAH